MKYSARLTTLALTLVASLSPHPAHAAPEAPPKSQPTKPAPAPAPAAAPKAPGGSETPKPAPAVAPVPAAQTAREVLDGVFRMTREGDRAVVQLQIKSPKPNAQQANPTPTPKPPSPQPPQSAQAANTKAGQSTSTNAPRVAAPASGSQRKSVADATKGQDRQDGYFTLYRDNEKGGVQLYIRKAQLGEEFIYFTHTSDGVVVAGFNRGNFGDSEVMRIERSADKLLFIQEHTRYYFDPQHPLARAAGANTSDAVLAAEGIVAEDKDGYLVNASGLFLKEQLLQIKSNGSSDGKAVLGKLSESKTRFTKTRSYPDNTVLHVEYVYDNPSPTWDDENHEVADRRAVSVRMQHSLIRMPQNDYKPRHDDARLGYFMTQVNDMTSTEITPWRDLIHRWHLVKKEPGKALSEPVTPITFWIENTTPLELREVIKTAGEGWNAAFESAGFKNAVVIKQQPDDATWDADDIHYNVLRWTSSPKPPFGGYGPSFVNPRSGEIIGADIMLEYSVITKRLASRRVFDLRGNSSSQSQDAASPIDPHQCLAADATQQGTLLGNTALRLRAADKVEFDQLLRESLTQLILHEIGHTLGLNHNFRSSYLHDPVKIHDRALTEKVGLTGSVMDYSPINLAPIGTKQGQYFTTCPGPYDHWAITYGYSEALADTAAETQRLATIAARSHEPQLAFANDADDMRNPGKAIDPRAMLFDLTSDPVTYAEQRCEYLSKAQDKLLAIIPTPGQSHQELVQAVNTLTTDMGNALTAVSRHIGGVQVERAVVGQGAKPAPLQPEPEAIQRHAMAVLARYAFGPQALSVSPALITQLQQQRRGFDFRSEGEDPKLHWRAISLQRSLLDHLLHSSTQHRILDSALYGNTYSLESVMSDLTTAIFPGLIDQASTAQQNLQIELTTRLINILHGPFHLPAAQAIALSQLEKIRALPGNSAHWRYLQYKIKRGLDEEK